MAPVWPVAGAKRSLARCLLEGVGFRVQGLGFRVQGVGFGV